MTMKEGKMWKTAAIERDTHERPCGWVAEWKSVKQNRTRGFLSLSGQDCLSSVKAGRRLSGEKARGRVTHRETRQQAGERENLKLPPPLILFQTNSPPLATVPHSVMSVIIITNPERLPRIEGRAWERWDFDVSCQRWCQHTAIGKDEQLNPFSQKSKRTISTTLSNTFFITLFICKDPLMSLGRLVVENEKKDRTWCSSQIDHVSQFNSCFSWFWSKYILHTFLTHSHGVVHGVVEEAYLLDVFTPSSDVMMMWWVSSQVSVIGDSPIKRSINLSHETWNHLR